MQALRLVHDIRPRQIITTLLQHLNQQMSLRVTLIDAAVVDITVGANFGVTILITVSAPAPLVR